MKKRKTKIKYMQSEWLPRLTGDWECRECRTVKIKQSRYCPECGRQMENYEDEKDQL